MDQSNFEYLKKQQFKLFELGVRAEDYVYSDPQSSAVKLRCFAELFVSYIYKELNIPSYGANKFVEKLNNKAFVNAVEPCVVDKLELLRLKGNKAAHGTIISVKVASELVKEAWFLGAWLYVAYHGGLIEELPVFKAPQKTSTDDKSIEEDNERLEKALHQQTVALEDATAELSAIEQSQLETQLKMEALNKEVDQVKLAALKYAGQRVVANYDFEVEATRKKIGIDDVFAEYQLTDGQSELVNRLDTFLSSRQDNVFLLKGYAGTGKTFITKGLTEYFRAIRRNYILAAPTGKASKVIASKTKSPAYTIHKTIYSFKDIAEYKDENLDGSETYKFYAKLAVNELSVDTVYIVDESSMISDIYNESEFFHCGSGHLLKDFLKFVNLDHNDHRKKVIFIGDDAQLPPIGMKSSPALDPAYLSREYGLKLNGYELTEVVRQKADSGVMHNAVSMRKALKENVFNQLDFNLDFPDLSHIEYADVISRYLQSCGGKINGESIIIAHSNADVAAYNKRIREEFFPGTLEVSVGDKVMAVTNSDAHGFFISNGDFGQVCQVPGETEPRPTIIKRKSKETGLTEK
ncbi:AAA family ATPase, partial [Pseudomonadales bacterium]|nr:AAA family ATPase [Pseudomonadales bacterium]